MSTNIIRRDLALDHKRARDELRRRLDEAIRRHEQGLAEHSAARPASRFAMEAMEAHLCRWKDAAEGNATALRLASAALENTMRERDELRARVAALTADLNLIRSARREDDRKMRAAVQSIAEECAGVGVFPAARED